MYSWKQRLSAGTNDIKAIPAFGQEPDPMSASGLEEHTVNLKMRPVRKRIRNQKLFAAGLLVMGLILPFAFEESGFIEDPALNSLVRTVFFGGAALLIFYSYRNTDPLGIRGKKAPVLADLPQVSRKVFGSPWGTEEYEMHANKRSHRNKIITGTMEEQFTFAGLEKLLWIPGARIVYGEVFSGKPYAGRVHTVVCGHKVGVVETLPHSRPFSSQDQAQASQRLTQYQTLLAEEWDQGIAGRMNPEVRGILVSHDSPGGSGYSISDAVEKIGNWFTEDENSVSVVDRQLLTYLIKLHRA